MSNQEEVFLTEEIISQLRKALSSPERKPVGKWPSGKDMYLELEVDAIKNLYIFKNSYPVKDILREYGFRFDKETKAWIGHKVQFFYVANKLWEYLSIEARLKAFRMGVVNEYTKNLRIPEKYHAGYQVQNDKNEALNRLNEYLGNVLRKYQIDGISKILSAYYAGTKGFILADEQGLGKTLSAIGFLYAVGAQDKTVLILVPNSLVENWRSEFIKYDVTGDFVRNISFKPEYHKICIIPYSKFSTKMYKDIAAINYDIIIADEVQYIKSYRSKRAKNFMKMIDYYNESNHRYFCLAMTGTLLKNRPLDAYNITKVIGLHDLNLFKFLLKFETDKNAHLMFSKYNRMGWAKYYKMIDPERVKRFKDLLDSSGLYLRRTKEEVMDQLPEKVRIVKPIVPDIIDNPELASAIENEKNIAEHLQKDVKLPKEVREKMSYYRRIVAIHKADVIIDMLTEFEDKDRLIIFAHHQDVIQKLKEGIENKFPYVNVKTIYGSTSSEERNKAVIAFQSDSDEYIWLLASLAVASEGLTLTKADTVVFAEMDWSISTLLQAEDRIHRIGQTSTKCFYYYYIMLDSLDQYIYNVLLHKSRYMSEMNAQSGFVQDMIREEKQEEQQRYEPP